jgi:hypothetical protein
VQKQVGKASGQVVSVSKQSHLLQVAWGNLPVLSRILVPVGRVQVGGQPQGLRSIASVMVGPAPGWSSSAKSFL